MKQNETYKFNKVCYQYFMDSNNDFSKMNIYANNINLSIQKFLIYVHNYIEENINVPEYVKVLDVVSTLKTEEEVISYLDSIKADINYLIRNFLSYYCYYRPHIFYLKPYLVDELKKKLTCYQNYLYRKLDPLRIEHKDLNIVVEDLVQEFINSNYSLTRFCFNNGLFKEKFRQDVAKIKQRNKVLYDAYIENLAMKDSIKEKAIKDDVLNILNFIKQNNNSIGLIDFCLLTNYDILELVTVANDVLDKENYILFKWAIMNYKKIDVLKDERLTRLFKTNFTFNIDGNLVDVSNEADIYTIINYLYMNNIPVCNETFKEGFIKLYKSRQENVVKVK